MKKSFAHPALQAQKDKPLVYTAMSKHLFYYRMFISVFVLENGGVPLNPFMIFDYFLLDAVDRDLIREGKIVRYFAIQKPHKIVETTKDGVDMEVEVAGMRHLL